MSGAEPWAAWKRPCASPTSARRREAEPADGARAEVGEDVAEHVLCDDDVERRGTLHEIEGSRVHIDGLEPDVDVPRGDLGHNLAEEAYEASTFDLSTHVTSGNRSCPAAARRSASAKAASTIRRVPARVTMLVSAATSPSTRLPPCLPA